MAKIDPAVLDHLEWLGFVQPTGLVVSALALARAGAMLDRRDIEGQRRLQELVEERVFDRSRGPEPYLPDFEAFARDVLQWRFKATGYAGTSERPVPAELEIQLPDEGGTVRPTFAVVEREPQEGRPPWQLLVTVLEPGTDFDAATRAQGSFEISPHGRMERLLRQTGVSAGLLFDGRVLRLVSAPKGETSGFLDFRVADMSQTSGRPICTAMRLLLNERRLLSLPRAKRLAALLEDSRKFQNEVSEKLAQQVLHALYELQRGLQAAHDTSHGELLRGVLREDPNQIYHALLTVILRLVFLLYAEERDLLPTDETFVRHYSLAGLYERLREDAALHPDTMDQRYGAWAQLLVLFRMIFDGASSEAMHLPERHGVLFDPDRFPFLEGRGPLGARQAHERIDPPAIPDGAIHRVLDNLLVLDGERLSYRALDVEQIGSVYETMMGFRLETATGRSVAIKAAKKQGAPTTIDLEALLTEPGAKRDKWLQGHTDRKLSESAKKAVKAAESLEDLHAALLPVVDRAASPDLVPQGAMVLQPSEERRRSGSHYTPRALTEPIVRTTLEPILQRLREANGADATKPPRPEQLLDLKVCDPAMGSGAFLVETCRQLGDELVQSWRAHDALPEIPPDEDETLYARRLVAQRCLYGVDKNPVAVDLAKVSLWLVTLAKEHPLTFVDHALRHGDSLVGLSRTQVERFHWDPEAVVDQQGFETLRTREHLKRAIELRERIRSADDTLEDTTLRALWREAQDELAEVRHLGDLVLRAFFAHAKPKDREAQRLEYASAVLDGTAPASVGVGEGDPAITPFHWEFEFGEVFERENPGFDAVVGNPPFAGKNSIAAGNPAGYPDWLKVVHEGSHGNADLVAHFYRRAFDLLRARGTLGLIATNTLAQGDTRSTGLRWIGTHGGEIFRARKRVKWPGLAAVVVSVLHIHKGAWPGAKLLDDREVETITAFLFHRGSHDDPARLIANQSKSFQGSVVLGMGFTFDDTDTKGVATPIDEMHRLIESNPRNREVIFPYIGGEEVNSSPTHAHHRYVINFGERSEEECRERWPDLMAVVEEKVKPDRMMNNREVRKKYWWRFGETTPALFAAIAGFERVLVCVGGTAASKYLNFTVLPAGLVYSQTLCVLAFHQVSALALLQSRPHEVWARFFGATMKDDLRYNSSICFETFPFPENWESHPTLEAAGKTYAEFRAALMVKNDEGLTKTYNRFHDPEERDPEIQKLRELHAAMDRAVLDAYGWTDLEPTCEFLLDYEIDEEAWGKKKKPYRYRWPDDLHDEVLARLLELNQQRAAEERRLGLTKSTRKKPKRSRKKTTKRSTRRGDPTGDLFA
ncbi:MAG: N-6 DNA methylase [Planctomycetes bacterium]|nr:N-6 DNA methylase [Planctomycetota bacterium]